MTRRAKILVAVIVGLTVAAAGTVAFAASAIYTGGAVEIDVGERSGGGVSLSVPAGLAHLAIALAPDSVIDEALDEVRHEFEPFLPALRESWDVFVDTPDFVMVDVQSSDERVRIEKRGHQLLIEVGGRHDPGIRVAVPLRTIERILYKL